MAITRAQQAKQLLAQGGRIGLKGGADAATVGFDKSYDRRAGTKTSTGKDRPRSVDISPTGGVKTSTDAPDAPTTFIGGQEIDVIPENRDQRELLELQAAQKRQREIDKFINAPRKKNKLPGLLGMGIDFVGGFLPDSRKFFVENVVGKKGYEMTEEDYQDYMRARSAGLIDVAGNTIMPDRGDDPFIPINQMSTNMDQAPKEEVLSPIQQAILDRGSPLAFLATGGRVGLKGGADASQFGKSPSEQRSVDISPTGSVTLGSGPPEGPDDRGNNNNRDGNQPPSKKFTTTATDVVKEAAPYIIGGPFGILSRSDKAKKAFNLFNLFKGLKDLNIFTPAGAAEMTPEEKAQLLKDAGIEAGATTPPAETFPRFLADEYETYKDIMGGPAATESIVDEYKGSYPGLLDVPTEQLQERFEKGVADPNLMQVSLPGQNRFMAAGGGPVGGIMDLESGRQMYFLGKLVKKATRAVKKIVKSPIGKAALFATPFLMNQGLRNSALSFLFKTPMGDKVGFMDMLKGGLTGGGKFALGAGLTALPLLFQEDTNEDEYQKFLRERGAGAQLPAPIPDIRNNYRQYMGTAFLADGGRPEPVAKKTMPLLDMDGKEKDYRETGGFVDMGRMERADDVPARLSKNEFVFTADAVRNAGEGDIDKGAEVMYNMMKNLEAGGEVSEESQGLDGARRMFQTSQRLEEVL